MRKYLTSLKSGIVPLMPLLGLGVIGTPSMNQANAQTSPALFKPTRLEAYLAQYPVSKSEVKEMAKAREVEKWGDKYSVARSFHHKTAPRIAYDAGEHFKEDCKTAGGRLELMTSPYIAISKTSPHICLLNDGTALGALIAFHSSDYYNKSYARIFVLSPSGATNLKIAYQRDIDKEQSYKDQQRQKAAEQEARYTANKVIWAKWRETLAIGSDTHCGPVIGLRGPMVEVANNAQALWFKREQLYPVGARNYDDLPIRCGSY
jgi:hypothetical protein